MRNRFTKMREMDLQVESIYSTEFWKQI